MVKALLETGADPNTQVRGPDGHALPPTFGKLIIFHCYCRCCCVYDCYASTYGGQMAGHLIYVRTFHIRGKYVLQHIRDLKIRKPFRAAPP